MDARRRAAIATLVGLVGATFMVPGAGLVYLRKWRRAGVWLLGGVVALTVLSAVFVGPDVGAVETLPESVLVPYFVLVLLSVADTYWVARRTAASPQTLPGPLGSTLTAESGGDADGEAGNVCPACGQPADPDLAFCWYCTAPFDDAKE